MQENVNVTLPLNLINAVLQYLGTRSYAEVFQLVQALHSAVTPQLSASAQPEDVIVSGGGTD